MTAPDPWRKPSRCGDSACIEWREFGGYVEIRVTGQTGVLYATHEEWAAFRDAIKAGEFDDE